MWLHNANVTLRVAVLGTCHKWLPHLLVIQQDQIIKCLLVSVLPSPTPPTPSQEGGGYLVSSLKCREAKYAVQNGLPVYT